MLRAQNILYDRDDTGEFLHAYTDPFDDRFFFEIVQRIGDYQQYGAANASVRMAAQAKRRTAAQIGLLGVNENPLSDACKKARGKRHMNINDRLASTPQALLGAAAWQPLGAPHIARAADPIKIGLLLAKTGQIAGQTEYLANGSFLALEQRNNMIMGQPAELVWLDEPSPQGATQNMQKLVQENKVCAVLGGSLSSNALAEEAKAAELKIPFVCDNAAATDITGKNCNRYTFRLNTPVAVQQRMLAPYALKYGKKWYHITASYAFGQDILQELARAAEGRPAARKSASTKCR